MSAASQPRRTLVAFAATLALGSSACSHVVEHRASAPSVDDTGQITAHVEQRRGTRVATWKPYYTVALLGAIVASGAMMWTGFLAPNRPLSVTGIVLAATLPVVGAVPYVVTRDTPWTRTKWKNWEPAPGTAAELAVIGGVDDVLVRRSLTSGSDGTIRTQLGDSLCASGLRLELARVDLELTVDRKTPTARATVPAARVSGACGPRLSLLAAGGTDR